ESTIHLSDTDGDYVRINWTDDRPALREHSTNLPLMASNDCAESLCRIAPRLRSITSLFRNAVRPLESIRFLDLSPDIMRLPSAPGHRVLGERGENLSSVLREICLEDDGKETLIDWVRDLTTLDVTDIKFPVDVAGRVLLTLVDSNGADISAYSASDGTLRFLGLLAALLISDPAHVYFIDELATGIHPTRARYIVDLLESLADTGTAQVIATTHSPDLLRFMSDESMENAVVAYRHENGPRQHLRKFVDFSDNARDLIKTQGAYRLHAGGWLENIVAFSNGGFGS
ncbi:MAG: ATP-binding protein, partial [Polyangiaceae bacterium]|nr:ATP-binding protein [Polyangiaceae bacterium]